MMTTLAIWTKGGGAPFRPPATNVNMNVRAVVTFCGELSGVIVPAINDVCPVAMNVGRKKE